MKPRRPALAVMLPLSVTALAVWFALEAAPPASPREPRPATWRAVPDSAYPAPAVSDAAPPSPMAPTF